MAADSNVNFVNRAATGQAAQAITDEIYSGALVAMGDPIANTTSANRGRALPYDDTVKGLAPLGLAAKPTSGDLTASPIPRVDVPIEGHIFRLAVTGLAGDRTDNLRKVYATDDDTFTLTKPASVAKPVGVVHAYFDSSEADVYIFGMYEQIMFSMSGADTRTELLAVITGVFSSGGNAATGIVMPYHGRLESVYGVVVEALTGSSPDLDINLELDTSGTPTNVTGGVISWTDASAIGAKIAGSAITAENRFHRGDLLDIEVAVNTAGTGGLLAIYGVIDLDVSQ